MFASRRNESFDYLEHVDLRAYPTPAIRQIVRYRRGADKLNHFERWAVRATAHLRAEDRLGALRAVLPGGLVGEHALSHLESITELNPNNPDWRLAYSAQRAAAHRRAESARELIRAEVKAALHDGRHGDLNRAMKAVAVGDPPTWRSLAGDHDIEPFLNDVLAVERWSVALGRFLTRSRQGSDG